MKPSTSIFWIFDSLQTIFQHDFKYTWLSNALQILTIVLNFLHVSFSYWTLTAPLVWFQIKGSTSLRVFIVIFTQKDGRRYKNWFWQSKYVECHSCRPLFALHQFKLIFKAHDPINSANIFFYIHGMGTLWYYVL